MNCQIRAGRCQQPATVRVTHETAPMTGRNPGPGLMFDAAVCPGHLNIYMDEVRLDGGRIVATDYDTMPADETMLERTVHADIDTDTEESPG